MKKRFVLYTLLILLLVSCSQVSMPSQEEEAASPSAPVTPSVPEGGAPPAPGLTGEEISCTYFVSPTGDDAMPGSESQPWGSFQYAMDSAQPGDTVCFREGDYAMWWKMRFRSHNRALLKPRSSLSLTPANDLFWMAVVMLAIYSFSINMHPISA